MNVKKVIMIAALTLSPTAAIMPSAYAAGIPVQTVTQSVYDTTGQPETLVTTAVPAAKALILYMNSSKMEQNGAVYTAARPMTVKKGVSYAGLRSLAERLGFKVSYDSKTRETLVLKDGLQARFRNGSAAYVVNGTKKAMRGATYNDKGVFMVPLTSITSALNIPYTVDQPAKKVILRLSTKPTASFTIQPIEIFAGQTTVRYQTQSASPDKLPIVDERWVGREDVYQTAGTYPVTYSVMNSNGEWSDPYTLNVTVQQPNEPPVAMFDTDKSEYMMGEPIVITDQSTDEENAIVDQQWINNELAFFHSGPVTIQLTVKDKHGATSEFEKTIAITGETMYSEKEFHRLFTPVGKNFLIDGVGVKTMKTLPFTYTTEPYTLFRSSGPESVDQEGILYQDTISGATRFLLHHKSKMTQNTKLYLIARNTQSTPAVIHIENSGMAGPTPFPEIAGQMSVARYFSSMMSGDNVQDITLSPGESKIIFTELNQKALQLNDIVTFTGELTSDSPIQYTALMVNANLDPLAALNTLPILDPIISITRGTFGDSNRVFNYEPLAGEQPERIYLTDNDFDQFQDGYDGIKGESAINSGNYSVLYKIRLARVAPNTLITFNPRGGLFRGAALVNQNVVTFSHIGAINTSNQNSVLYRTGDQEESVDIWITPPAGSNLPFCLLLSPL